ncbi:MAG: hypothetical protein AAB465_03225 [Patescibacteria group bacterium]
MSTRSLINQMVNKGASISEIAREYSGPIHLKEAALAFAITQAKTIVGQVDKIKELTMGEDDPRVILAKQARMVLCVAGGDVRKIAALLKELVGAESNTDEAAQLIALMTGDWNEQAVLIHNYTADEAMREALIAPDEESELKESLKRAHIKMVLAQSPSEQFIAESEIMAI